MFFSKYNHLYKESENQYLLYNSESNSFAELDEDTYQILLKVKNGDIGLDGIPMELSEEFIKARILVKNQDEVFYEKKLNYFLHNCNSHSLGFAVATTTFCNFNCPYCYEENRKSIFMSEKTENDFVNYIKRYRGIETVNITWYGGEPLANFKTIRNIIRLLEENSIKLGTHSIVTNGYLLDEEKSHFFNKYPLNDIQITIDGKPETHNKRRVLSDGNGTYDKIISNIDYFIQTNPTTRIAIRVNIDASNHKEFSDIHQELTKRWTNNVFVYPAFVRDYTENCSQSCSVLNQTERVNFYIQLYEKYNMDVNFYPSLKIGGCGANNIHYYVVGPEGELYKCWNDIGINNKVVGYLDRNELPNINVLAKYLVGPTMFEDDECRQCQIFPICDGGCHWMRLENKFGEKKFDLCSNRKNNMENFLRLHCKKLSIRNSSSMKGNNNGQE